MIKNKLATTHEILEQLKDESRIYLQEEENNVNTNANPLTQNFTKFTQQLLVETQ